MTQRRLARLMICRAIAGRREGLGGFGCTRQVASSRSLRCSISCRPHLYHFAQNFRPRDLCHESLRRMRYRDHRTRGDFAPEFRPRFAHRGAGALLRGQPDELTLFWRLLRLPRRYARCDAFNGSHEFYMSRAACAITRCLRRRAIYIASHSESAQARLARFRGRH